MQDIWNLIDVLILPVAGVLLYLLKYVRDESGKAVEKAKKDAKDETDKIWKSYSALQERSRRSK